MAKPDPIGSLTARLVAGARHDARRVLDLLVERGDLSAEEAAHALASGWIRSKFEDGLGQRHDVVQWHQAPAVIIDDHLRRTIDVDRMLWGHGYSAGALHGDGNYRSR